MRIVRGKLPSDNFTIVSNSAARDDRLSFRARGVLLYVLGHVEGWSVSSQSIANEGSEGRAAVLKALKELETLGYLTRTKFQGDRGRWEHSMTITDTPSTRVQESTSGDQSAVSVSRSASDGELDSIQNTITENQSLSSEVASDPRPESKDDAPSHTVTRLCNLLADAIEANGSKRPTITKAWNRDMRLMLERDGHSENQISNMIAWCQADVFWRTNILSVTKLRSKYDQMRLKALAESTAQATPVDLAGERRAKAERERTDALIRELHQAAEERAPMPEALKNLRKEIGRS